MKSALNETTKKERKKKKNITHRRETLSLRKNKIQNKSNNV